MNEAVLTLRPSELQQLYRAAQNDRDYMLIKTTGKHGLRNSEAISLKKRHIDFDRSILRILNSKNDKSREVLIPSGFESELKAYTQKMSPDAYLFNSKTSSGHVSRRFFQKLVRRCALRARLYPPGYTQEDVSQLPYEERIMPHTLRHSYAHNLLRQGFPMEEVQLLLGHESVSTTIDIYGNRKIEEMKGKMEEIEI